MLLLLISIVLAFVFGIMITTNVKLDGSFIATVVEYSPLVRNLGSQSPLEYMLANVDQYNELVIQAKAEGAQVIVFPEYGITGSSLHGLSQEDFRKLMQDFPDVGTSTFPVESDDNVVLRRLQEVAKDNELYLVVNLGTKEESQRGQLYYNTQVVFNPRGKIEATYRKYNLYGEEDLFDRPSQPDVSFFDTDFGVRIGLLICFDINYEHPAQELKANGVDVIAFSTKWVDELPFLTAIQYHSGWAMANDMVLMSSGMHEPRNGSLGSGIYQGQSGILNYTFDPRDQSSRLITARIQLTDPLEPHPDIPQSPVDHGNHTLLEQDLSQHSFKQLHQGFDDYSMDTSQGIACAISVDVDIPVTFTGSYALVSHHGIRGFGGGNYSLGVASCGVVICTDTHLESLESCGNRPDLGYPGQELPKFNYLRLEQTHGVGLRPMLVSADKNLQPLKPSELEYSGLERRSVVVFQGSITDLYSLGLYARDFQLDKSRARSVRIGGGSQIN